MSDVTLSPLPESSPVLDPAALDPAAAVLAEAANVLETVGEEAAVSLVPLDSPRRMLLVHAHPDDETIGTGATMAKYAADGALVTLLTCTLGEEGEVLVPELAHLASNQEDGLGMHRMAELAVAMEALGVTDHRLLGGAGRFRDSGMIGTPQNERADTFWRADIGEAIAALVAVLREVRPQVLVTYDEKGGYGHPDHIQAHRVALAAFDAAADPEFAPELGEPWQASKLYYGAIPTSVLQAGIDHLKTSGESNFFGADKAEDLGFGNPDEDITTEIDARDYLDHKIAAMRAHRTQIELDGPFFALSNNIGQQAFGVEYYILAKGERGPGDGPQGRETDLFAGII